MSSLDDVKPFPKPSERPIPKSRTYKPVPASRFNKPKYKARPPVPTPRNKVNQLVQHYENNIIERPVPKPRTYKPVPASRFNKPKYKARPPVPTPRNKVNQLVQHYENNIIERPVPKPRTKITQIPKIKELNQALKGHAKSYGIELQDNLNPLNHFTKTKELVESYLKSLLKDKKGFKFIETLEVMFEKDSIDSKTGKRVSIYKTAFFNGKAKTITKADDIEHELNMSRQEILNAIDKWVSEGSGWVID